MQVGTIKDKDGNDVPSWADMAGCLTRTFRDIDDWRSRAVNVALLTVGPF